MPKQKSSMDYRIFPSLNKDMTEKIAFTLLPFTVLFTSVTALPNRILLGLLTIVLLFRKWPFKDLNTLQKISMASIGLCIGLSLIANPIMSKELLLILTLPVYLLIYSLSDLSSSDLKATFINGVCLFAAVLLSTKLIEITNGGIDFFKQPQWWNQVLYKSLAGGLGSHPTYLSMYFLSALVALVFAKDLDLVYGASQRTGLKGLLLVTTLLLSVKIALLYLLILALHHIIYLVQQRKSRSLLIYLSMVLALVSIVLLNPGIRHRITNDHKALQSAETHNQPNRINERMALWKASAHEMVAHPVVGSSTRGIASRDAIFEEASRIYPYLEFPKNSHNNFLEAGVRYGFPGMIALLAAALSLFAIARKTGSDELFYLCLLLLLCSLTESFLFREQGIALLALLLSIFGSNYARDI